MIALITDKKVLPFSDRSDNMESTLQRSQRLYGKHSPAIAASEVTAKIPGCNAYAPPFQDGTHYEYREIISFGNFYGGSAKIRVP